MSLGMNNLLSLEQENDISVSLKLLLCLEMMLWSECSGLTGVCLAPITLPQLSVYPAPYQQQSLPSSAFFQM